MVFNFWPIFPLGIWSEESNVYLSWLCSQVFYNSIPSVTSMDGNNLKIMLHRWHRWSSIFGQYSHLAFDQKNPMSILSWLCSQVFYKSIPSVTSMDGNNLKIMLHQWHRWSSIFGQYSHLNSAIYSSQIKTKLSYE